MLKCRKLLVWSALLCGLIVVANAQFTQQGPKLVGAGFSGQAWQGAAVALSADGNTALVGGIEDNTGAGAVWVFTRSAGVWNQQGTKLIGSGAIAGALQGNSVALSADGNTALIGGPQDNNWAGAAWVFTRSNNIWSQQGPKFVEPSKSTYLGYAVALSADGNTGLVAELNGGVRVITRSGGVWTEGLPIITPSVATFSVALSADGNTALIGAPLDGPLIAGFTAGGTWVFTRSNGVWTQQGDELLGSDAIGGAAQGGSVSLSADGNTAITGGTTDNGYVGAAWVFTRSNGVWTQQGGKLVGSGGSFAAQGVSVSLSADGNTAGVGGTLDDNSLGATWLFHRSSGVWSQLGEKLVGSGAVRDPNGEVLQGRSVAMSADGHTALVGGQFDSNDVGAAWVFTAPEPSNTTLATSSNPSLYGQAVTFSATVTAGATGTVTFTVDGVPQSTVALTNSQAHFSISNLALGGHTISAAYGGDPTFAASTSNVVNQIVNPLGVMSPWPNTAVGLGQSIRLPITLAKPALPPGVTIYLNSSDPSRITVTPSVFIPAGKTAPNLPPVVTALNLGTVNITATALGFAPVEQSLQVTASLSFARCCVTISGTTTQIVPLNLSGPAPSGGLTIHLASDSTAVATVPTTVTFPAKATSVNVPITGVSAGTVVIHASAPPALTDTTVRVTVH